MQELLDQLWGTLSQATAGYLPKLAGAIGLLILFWLGALVLAALVRSALRRTELENKLFGWLLGEKDVKKLQTERWVSRAVFWVVMLFGLMAFFNVLDLLLVTQPLNRMLGAVFEYLPRVLSAGLLLLVAVVVASVVRLLLSRVLQLANVDERLGKVADERRTGSISQTVSGTVYWLILLLFLPLVLDALALEGLLAPLQTMLSQVLGFLPNLLAAALILFVGWLAAKIVRQVVTNLLAVAGVDNVGERAGVTRVLGTQTLSGLAGLLVYALILIPVAIAALDALQLGNISEPAGQMLSMILSAIPAVLTAALILGIAYIVGRFAAGLVSDLLSRIGFDNILAHLGLVRETPARGQGRPSEIVGYLVLVAVLFFASMEAADELGFEALGDLLKQFVTFGGHLLLGLAIFGVGLYLANLAGNVIRSSKPQQRELMAAAARIAIIVLAAAMALREMGLAEDIITWTYGAALVAISFAAALAFGLGSRDIASAQVEKWIRSFREGSGGGGRGGAR